MLLRFYHDRENFKLYTINVDRKKDIKALFHEEKSLLSKTVALILLSLLLLLADRFSNFIEKPKVYVSSGLYFIHYSANLPNIAFQRVSTFFLLLTNISVIVF